MLLEKVRIVSFEEACNLPIIVLANLPGRLGILARRAYWKTRLLFMGKGVRIGRNVSISCPENVSLGDNCWIDDNVTILAGPPGKRSTMHRLRGHAVEKEGKLIVGARVHVAINVVLQAHGGIEIGEDVGIAAGSNIYSLSHHYRNPGDPNDQKLYIFGPMVEPAMQSMIIGSVELRKGSAVGLNSVVLPGSKLGEYSWLGSASLLSGETPDGAILAGNPAKVVRYRGGFSKRDE